jgi:hypothetical protein
VDAPLVRAYLQALPDLPPDGRSLERLRFCLSTLQGPDVRYLVAAIVGPDATPIARAAAAVLRAAGAPTAVLGRRLEDTTVDGEPIDAALLGRAGTLAAAAGYQLADAGRDLGELTRREATVLVGLTAFAEAGQRVALLVDEAVDPADAAHAPRPDLLVIGMVDAAAADRALALVPDGRPVVVAQLASEVRDRVEGRLRELGTPALVGGRDHRIEERAGRLAFVVREDDYVTVDPIPEIGPAPLATGIATALALGVMGIRMREDWVIDGLAALRREPVAS